jgi:hypothetical protein
VRKKIQQRCGKREASRPAVRPQLLLSVPVWSFENRQEKGKKTVKPFEFANRAQQGRRSSYAFSLN